jgi:hypothetical protein
LPHGDGARRDDAVVRRHDVGELKPELRRLEIRTRRFEARARRELLGREPVEVRHRQRIHVGERFAALERRFRVRELGAPLVEHRLFRRDLRFEQGLRHRDETLALGDAIAYVDEHFRDPVAADLGRDDDVLPREHGARHRNGARELDARERRRRHGHDGCARGRQIVGRIPATSGECAGHAEQQRSTELRARLRGVHVGVVLAIYQFADIISAI